MRLTLWDKIWDFRNKLLQRCLNLIIRKLYQGIRLNINLGQLFDNKIGIIEVVINNYKKDQQRRKDKM